MCVPPVEIGRTHGSTTWQRMRHACGSAVSRCSGDVLWDVIEL